MKGFLRGAAGLAVLLLIVGGGVELRARLGSSGDGGPERGRPGLVDLEQRARAWAAEIEAALPGSGATAAEAGAPAAAPHPFTGFAAPGERERLAAAQERLAAPGEPRPRFALLLGGAGAGAWADGAGEALGAALAAGDGRPLEWLRFDDPRFKQPQQLTLLLHLFSQGLRPDLVIDYQGFNEWVLAADNARRGVHPNYPAQAPWLELHTAKPAELQFAQRQRREGLLDFADRVARQRDRVLARSAVGAEWLRRGLEREWLELSGGLPPAYLEAQFATEPEGHLRGPAFPDDAAARVELIAEHWERSVLAAHAAAAARGVLYVALLQPLDLHLAELAPLARDFVERGYRALRPRGARLAAAGVAFVDGDALSSNS
ncbi:MAG: hypothetical protein ACYS26_05835, partial [Planctomycetota bacterium]